jgi:hypothetical protein
MGKCSEGIAASEGSDGLGSCKAHHVGSRPQKDRGGAAGTLGQDEGWEEGGVGQNWGLRFLDKHDSPTLD